MKLPRIISAMVKLLTTIKYVLIYDKMKESFWRPIDPQESKARQHVFQLLWECQYFHKMLKLQKAFLCCDAIGLTVLTLLPWIMFSYLML